VSHWVHSRPGLYVRDEKVMNDKHWVRGLVMQDGERWISKVEFDGELVDMGEWNGRDIALVNARSAMKRAVANRGTRHLERATEDDDDDNQ
jgi:hypothetical protein